ncbi:hypothetical protein L3Q82_023449 [Scortum barcoo]|uniref:Uncharacterized protein n=1 Tax=Scortum barcoo TaxID=214431 RepID=A0ACB8WY90_9TELE|nr:hypothetical protein L3Q82_023449 [Scortum barcoo]
MQLATSLHTMSDGAVRNFWAKRNLKVAVLLARKGQSTPVLPQKAGVLQHLQEAATDLLPVCGSERPPVRSSVLGGLKKKEAVRLDKLVRKAGSVVGTELDSLTSVAERRTLNRLLSIIDNPSHPLHSAISRQRSSFSDRLLSLSCSTDRLRRSFLPHMPYGSTTPRGER